MTDTPSGEATVPEIEPFALHVPDHDLADLLARLDRVRLPEPETVPDSMQGIELRQLVTLLDAWRQHDWRAREARWNAIPHYRVRLDGLGIAFWHVRSPEPTALPLLMTHGRPGSVLEFENVLGPLSDPVAHGGSARDAFHVVVPALPGFGFSDRPRERGRHPGRTARAWAELVTVLGYRRFGAHGGDWGAFVSTELARLAPVRSNNEVTRLRGQTAVTSGPQLRSMGVIERVGSATPPNSSCAPCMGTVPPRDLVRKTPPQTRVAGGPHS
ncbi:epoxide hydrolase [Nonomuraea sp. NPDC003709]|uniref:epoxide hydrolase family protein n=1 Tax=Nonomuraea sp. NPDC003709 TaxID=3154450 RepID=UPI0033A8D300